MNKLILLCALIFPFNVSALINGAEQVEIFPSVQLFFKNGSHVCSGTFIDSYTILTAAHCLVEPEEKWESFSLELEFIYDHLKQKVPFELVKLIPHPKFKKSLIHSQHDIGIIKIAYNNYFVDFPSLAMRLNDDKKVILYGCGRIGIRSKETKCLKGENRVFNFFGHLAMWGNSSHSLFKGQDVSVAPNDSGGALVDSTTGEILGVHWGTTLNKYFSKFNISILSFSTSLMNKDNYDFVNSLLGEKNSLKHSPH